MFPGRRPLAALGALSLVAAAPQAARETPPTVHFSAAIAEQWIPFEWRPGGVIVVTAQIDGKPARVLIDTGFTDVTLARSYAEAQRLPLAPIGRSFSVGGVTLVERAPAPDIELGGLRLSGGEVRVIDLSGLNSFVGRPVDLVLGAALLARYALEIDFDTHRLRLLPSGARPRAGVDVPVVLGPGPRVLIDVRIDHGAPVPVMLDLGSAQSLSLRHDVPLPPGERFTDLASIGAGGLAISRVVTLDRIALGRATQDGVMVEIEPRDAFLSQNGLKGLIGLGVLARYNLVLDVAHRRLTLAPRARPDPVAAKSTVGLQIISHPDRIDVIHVMSGSPAERAGLRKGESICAIDGKRLRPGWPSGPLGQWSISPPGTRITIGLCDGRKVPLVAEAFY